MDSQTFKETLKRMGVPLLLKDNKIRKKDLLSLQFKESGLEVEKINELETEKIVGCNTYKTHLRVTGGNEKTLEAIFEKNKINVTNNILSFFKQNQIDCVTDVLLKLKAKNDENIWIDVQVLYDFDKFFNLEDIRPFYYQLIERS